MSACVHTDRYYPSHVQRHVHQMTRVVIVISSCLPPRVCSLQHCTSGCSARHIIFTYGRSRVQITTWRPLSVTEVSTVFFSPVTDVVYIHSNIQRPSPSISLPIHLPPLRYAGWATVSCTKRNANTAKVRQSHLLTTIASSLQDENKTHFLVLYEPRCRIYRTECDVTESAFPCVQF